MTLTGRLAALERRHTPGQDDPLQAEWAKFVALSPEARALWFRNVADLAQTTGEFPALLPVPVEVTLATRETSAAASALAAAVASDRGDAVAAALGYLAAVVRAVDDGAGVEVR